MVWERSKLIRESNSEEAENPAAWKRDLKWAWMIKEGDEEDGKTACDRRTEAEKGNIRRTGVVVKYWKSFKKV